MIIYTENSTMTRLNILIIHHNAFVFKISLRDENRVKFNKKKGKHKGDLRHFCLWMKMFAYKIKKLTAYSRDGDFGFI